MPKIITNFGASETRYASGASLNFADGGQLQMLDATPANGSHYVLFKAGNNSFFYHGGSGGSPVVTGSPGDLLWMPRSASTMLYVNIGNGTASSRWAAFSRTDAGSQIPS